MNGLLDYVQSIKPFHTKVHQIDVTYVHNDNISVGITENLTIGINIVGNGNITEGASNQSVVCTAGYDGANYGGVDHIAISSANQTISFKDFPAYGTDYVLLSGDASNQIYVGNMVEIQLMQINNLGHFFRPHDHTLPGILFTQTEVLGIEYVASTVAHQTDPLDPSTLVLGDAGYTKISLAPNTLPLMETTSTNPFYGSITLVPININNLISNHSFEVLGDQMDRFNNNQQFDIIGGSDPGRFTSTSATLTNLNNTLVTTLELLTEDVGSYTTGQVHQVFLGYSESNACSPNNDNNTVQATVLMSETLAITIG